MTIKKMSQQQIIDYSQWVRRIMAYFGDTPQQFADRLGVSKRIVAYWISPESKWKPYRGKRFEQLKEWGKMIDEQQSTPVTIRFVG